MVRVLQFSRLIHQFLACSLALLFGPAPLASLLALPSEPECQMACCDRKRHAASCARHQTVVTGSPDVTSIHFEASTNCPPNCSCAGIARPLSDQVLASLRTTIRLTSAEPGETHSIPPPAVRTAIDPSLYQRPPPLPV